MPISPAPEGSPNVIFISIDSLRSDHLGCYGYDRPTSPVLDRLASEGALFESVAATTSWTLPSHMAMFTSLPDAVHGVEERGTRYVTDHPLLAEVMQAAGYTTAGFYAGPFLHPGYGFKHGFDEYVNCTSFIVSEDQSLEEFRHTRKESRASRFDITNPRIFDKLSEWFDGKLAEPFFLFVHYWDVHSDFIPPAPFDKTFDPDYVGDLDIHDITNSEAIRADMDPRDLEHLVALYDGEILWTDGWIGKLLELLEAKGLSENTAIVLTADHGEAFFEHGEFGHGQDLHEEVVRVPLIVRYPGKVAAGQRIPEQVRTIDIYPTILSLAGLEPVQGTIGVDLAPRLLGATERLEVPPAPLALGHPDTDKHRQHFRALRTNEWKVIQDVRSGDASWFDLGADPGEQNPFVAADHPLGRSALAELVDLARLHAGMRASLSTSGDAHFDMSPEMMERLRALGYIK